MHPTPIDILTHVPTYVWVILSAILVLGIKQLRETAMSAPRLVLLPAFWLCFGAWGVHQSFGLEGPAGLGWLTGIALGALAVYRLRWPGQVRYDADRQLFLVPDHGAPLGLMLKIFALKFSAGLSLALHPELAHSLGHAIGFSAAFGLCSGAFLGRSVNILSTRPQGPGAQTASAQ